MVAAPVADTQSLARTKPHMLLADAGLRDQDSLHVAAVLKRELSEASVVVMDLLPVREAIAEFVKVGVAGFILKDAARRLGISVHAVRSHVRNVMEKLALHTRLQIAGYSRR